MRRFLLLTLCVFVLLGSYGLARGQSYGSDITTSGNAIESGHTGANVPGGAYADDGASTSWISSCSNAACVGVGYIGQDFGSGNAYEVRYLSIKQGNNSITSVVLQSSSNGSSWNAIQTITIVADTSIHFYTVNASAPYRYWRLLANAQPTGSWIISEIEMMELLSWPTNTPTTGPSETPTITLTPSITPSPTPNYFVEVTSTQGSPMRFERSATAGDLLSFAMSAAIFMLILLYGFWVWWKRPHE